MVCSLPGDGMVFRRKISVGKLDRRLSKLLIGARLASPTWGMGMRTPLINYEILSDSGGVIL